jgi:hypothetical protein
VRYVSGNVNKNWYSWFILENKRPTSPTVEEVSDEDGKTSPPPLGSTSPSPPMRNPPHRVASPPRPILSRRSSVSGTSRAGTPSVRFAEITPRDVFTYPSAPTSPKRTSLMIEAPPAEGSGEGVTKIQWHGKLPATDSAESGKDVPVPVLVSGEPESGKEAGPIIASTESEPNNQHAAHPLSQVMSTSTPSPSPSASPPGLSVSTSLLAPPQDLASLAASPISLNLEPDTPEAIRQQYFPNEPQPQDVPSLQWMADLPEIPDTPITSEYAPLYSENEKDAVRFNLAGTPIPYERAKELPVHDGLHHNSRTSAGKSTKSGWVWMCKAGVGAVCVGVAAAVSWKAAL